MPADWIMEAVNISGGGIFGLALSFLNSIRGISLSFKQPLTWDSYTAVARPPAYLACLIRGFDLWPKALVPHRCAIPGYGTGPPQSSRPPASNRRRSGFTSSS